VARPWLVACACFVLACSGTGSGMVPQEGSVSASVAEQRKEAGAGRELIPAEWTVAEDTSETGEVTTRSLQLPSAREIGGLADEEAPRLILRCVDGRVQAFIDMESSTGEAGAPDSQSVQVQLDSAPACE
jgi:hypothetical protein